MAIPLVDPKRLSDLIDDQFHRPIPKEKGSPFYLFLKGLLFALKFLPAFLRAFLAKSFGTLAYYLFYKARQRGITHLKQALGKTQGDPVIPKLMKKYFQHLILMILEIAKIPSWGAIEMKEQIIPEGENHYYAALKKGKGVIIVTGHFGNFAVMAHATSLLFTPAHFVFRYDIKKKWIAPLVKDILCRHGNEAVARGGAMATLQKILQQGGTICTLVDQRGGGQNRQTCISFLGKPFLFNKGTALLAQQSGAPVLPLYNYREESGHFRLVCGPEIPMAKTDHPEADLRENTTRILATLDQAIRKRPEQWLFWPWSGFDKDFAGER